MPALKLLGPLPSVADRHAELTVIGDTVDQTAMMDDAALDGVVLTLSVAARHWLLGTRLPVSHEEAEAWVREIVGDVWAEHVLPAGALSTRRSERSRATRLTTQFFYLFIGADGRPQDAPASFMERLSA
ncbi:hypothetical protein [Microbacterium sp. MYb66]|uniref:hypothetical protein n=1 Tax=Microbacterium sp. MYb66 TaxID=1848692 RepID=UPI000CFF38CF|nr:hypothetical protein [Microbacterium sp. MYb66]PRA82076.1 hypothetical protein CQ045_05100 [Microbacterium sp. MYb66]